MSASSVQPLESVSRVATDRDSAVPTVFRRQTAPEAGGPMEVRRLAQAIARAKAGDREAVRYLYCRYADNVYGYVSSLVRNQHDAEDVTQNVFAKLLTSISKYEERSVPFSAWILRVARNAALDHLRRQHSIPVAEVRSAGQADEVSGAGDAVREGLDALSSEQRQVILLRHLLGMSPTEIAEGTGRTKGSVYALHHRGRAVLREALTALDVAPSTRACCPA